jgi:hypothetical protein
MKKDPFWAFFDENFLFYTTVNPGSGTRNAVLRFSSTVILNKSAGTANPSMKG